MTFDISKPTVGALFLLTLVAYKVTSQINQCNKLTKFEILESVEGLQGCPVDAIPYKSYAVDRISSCVYDCKTLKRQTSNAVGCVGFIYNDGNNTCQLYTSDRRLYFTVQPSCTYHVNLEIAGTMPPVCPASFNYNDTIKGCYATVRKNLNWDNAAQYCQALVPDGHLVFINSSEETEALIPIASNFTGCNSEGYYGQAWWIGIQSLNRLTSGPFRPFYWARNSTSLAYPVGYNNWNKSPQEPNGDYCADLTSWRTWNDHTCNTSLCFICELDL